MSQDYSYWEFDTHSREWDVCIIGCGITGLCTGISLLEQHPNLQVLAVDRWFIPLGASTRNAGFSCFGSPTEILTDVDQMGEDAAINLLSKRWNGLLKLRSRIDHHYTQFENLGGYELYHKEAYEKVAEQVPYINQLLEQITGHEEVFSQVEVPPGINGFSHAVYNPYEGQLHPGYLMEHLKYQYLSLGGKMQTGYAIDFIEEQADYVQLFNELALPIMAKKVIVATNAFAAELLPQLDVHGARNHVLLTSPIDQLPWKGCFHYDRGYYYFRNVGKRILLGGARNHDLSHEETDQFGTNPVIVDALHQFLFDHLVDPGQCQIDYQWSGIIGIGEQKLPIVCQVSPRVLAGARLSGMGIALASLIGEELAQMALQQV